MPVCLRCKKELKTSIRGVWIHKHCTEGKSMEVLKVEQNYSGKPIEDVLVFLIKSYDTWEDRYKALGVSKVTLYAWVKKYLGLTPQQAVRELKAKKAKDKIRINLQTGSRDYLCSSSTLFLSE